MYHQDAKQHRDYISVVNVFAAFSVVALHCNSCFWLGPSQGRSWFTSNFIETTLYCAVPLFFMITGVTLLNYRERMDTKTYIRKRCEKTVVPFLAWSVFSLLWAIAVPWKGIGEDHSVIAIVNGLINCKYCSIYWFFPPLFAVYLSIPVLSLADHKKEACIYISVAGTIFLSLVPFICSLLHVKWNPAFVPPLVTGYLTYVAIGWVIDQTKLNANITRAIYVAGFIGWVIQLIGVFATSTPNGVNRLFKGYTNLPTVMQACAIFLWFRSVDWRDGYLFPAINRLCDRLSTATFGVYLTHWYVIELFYNILDVNRQSIVWRTIGSIVVFSICICITKLLQQIPLIRKAIP